MPVGTGRLFSGGGFSPTVFSADFSRLSVGDMSASAFLTATGFAFTRASDGYSVQTSPSTIITGFTGNDRPRIGQYDVTSASRGLVFEEARRNVIPDSTSFGAVGMTPSFLCTYTADYVAGPDPAGAMADRMVLLANGFANHYNLALLDNLGFGVGSFWLRATTSSVYQGSENNVFGTKVVVNTPSSTPIDSTWRRIHMGNAPGVAPAAFNWWAPVDSFDRSGQGGLSPAAGQDVCAIYTQMEETSTSDINYSTELITTTGTRLARAIERLTYVDEAPALLAADGSIRFEVQFTAKGAVEEYLGTLCIWNVDVGPTNSVTINPATRVLSISINGIGRSFPAMTAWAQGDHVKLFVCGGAGQPTTFAYSINGAASVTATPQASLAGSPPPGTFELFQFAAGSILLTSWIHKIATYKTGLSPAWV